MNGCPLFDDIAELLHNQKPGDLQPEMLQAVVSAQSKQTLPQSEALVEFCAGLELDFLRALALVLKREWEGFFENPNDAVAEDGGLPMSIDGSPATSFRPDTRKLFALFESRDRWASRSGYPQDLFDPLVREMMLAQLHLRANAGPEVDSFVHRARRQTNLLAGGSVEAEQAFWEAKINWLYLQEELGDKLLLLESRRLKNANIHREWMILFGSAYILLEEQTQRLELLQLKIRLLEADPRFSAQALDAFVKNIAAGMQQKLNDLRLELSMSAYRQKAGNGRVMENARLNAYLGRCKKLLRQIWMLIHPDRLCRHSSYAKLTAEQKHQLQELWHRVLRVRPEELGFSEGQLGYAYRSDLMLQEILRKARAILQFAGIDVDTDLMISGDTPLEQLAWLKRAIRRLTAEISNVTAELKVLIEDPLVLEKAAVLSCSVAQQDKIRDDLRKKAVDVQRQADELEKQLEALLNHDDPSN